MLCSVHDYGEFEKEDKAIYLVIKKALFYAYYQTNDITKCTQHMGPLQYFELLIYL